MKQEAEEKAKYRPDKEERRERAKEEAREAKREAREAEREQKKREKEEERERLRQERERLPDGWTQRTKAKKDGSGETIEFLSPTGTVYKSYKAVWKAVDKEEEKLVESKKSQGFMASFLSGQTNQSARKQRTKEEVEAEAEAAMDLAFCEAADRAERKALADKEAQRQQQLVADALDRGDTVVTNKGKRKGGPTMTSTVEANDNDEDEDEDEEALGKKSNKGLKDTEQEQEQDPYQLAKWKCDGSSVSGMAGVFGDDWGENLHAIASYGLAECMEAVEGMRGMCEAAEDADTKEAAGFVIKFTEHVIAQKEKEEKEQKEKQEKHEEEQAKKEQEKSATSTAALKEVETATTSAPNAGLSESEQGLETWKQKYLLVGITMNRSHDCCCIASVISMYTLHTHFTLFTVHFSLFTLKAGAKIPGMLEKYPNWKAELMAICDMDDTMLEGAGSQSQTTGQSNKRNLRSIHTKSVVQCVLQCVPACVLTLTLTHDR